MHIKPIQRPELVTVYDYWNVYVLGNTRGNKMTSKNEI